MRATGSTINSPQTETHLAFAHAQLGQFKEAWHCIGEAMTIVETTKEKWFEAEVHRTAGEISVLSPKPDPTKVEVNFKKALSIAREQKQSLGSCARRWALPIFGAIRANDGTPTIFSPPFMGGSAKVLIRST